MDGIGRVSDIACKGMIKVQGTSRAGRALGLRSMRRREGERESFGGKEQRARKLW